MRLVLDHCIVRAFRPDDAESIARHIDNINIWRNVRDMLPHPYRVEDAREFIAAAIRQTPQVSFAIEADGAAVGGIGVRPGEDVYRVTGEIGFWLGEDYWGRGIMTGAVTAFSRYAFEAYSLRRLEARVYEWNTASRRVLEKAGYEREAFLRDCAIKNGRLIGCHLYAKWPGAGGADAR